MRDRTYTPIFGDFAKDFSARHRHGKDQHEGRGTEGIGKIFVKKMKINLHHKSILKHI